MLVNNMHPYIILCTVVACCSALTTKELGSSAEFITAQPKSPVGYHCMPGPAFAKTGCLKAYGFVADASEKKPSDFYVDEKKLDITCNRGKDLITPTTCSQQLACNQAWGMCVCMNVCILTYIIYIICIVVCF